MSPTIETDRLVFREFTLDDFPSCHAYAEDPVVSEFQSWGPNTEEDTRFFLKLTINQQKDIPRKTFEFALIEKATKHHIGGAGIRIQPTPNNEGAIGYSLARGSWGKGLGTEACQAIIKFGFEDLELNRIWALVVPENQASVHVLEKSGLKREGTLRQGLKVRGQFIDCYLYATIKSDFLSRP